METDKMTFEDPDVQATADAIAAAVASGELSERDAASLSMWHAQLAEARACLAKLLVVLESHEANRQPLLTAALTWAVLDAKLPAATELRIGWLNGGDVEGPSGPDRSVIGRAAVPHLWALTHQPADVLEASRLVWGPASPRAAASLVTTLGGFPVSHLTDAVVLGRGLRAGREKDGRHASLPLPDPSAWRLMPRGGEGGGEEEAAAAARMAARLLTTQEARVQFDNMRFVAERPEDFLRWAVPTEARELLYPLIVSGVFKEDPTRHEYLRIDDNEVQRLIEAQNRAAEEAAGKGGPAAAAQS